MQYTNSVMYIFLFSLIGVSSGNSDVTISESNLLQIISMSLNANLSHLQEGRVHAEVRDLYYGDGGEVKRDTSSSVVIIYKDDNISLDIAGGLKAVRTDDACFLWFGTHDPDAYIEHSTGMEMNRSFLRLLPQQNVFHGGKYLLNPKAYTNATLSRKMSMETVNGKDLIKLEVVLKQYPKMLSRYYLNPEQSYIVVRYESLWDYGEGYVLLTNVEMEVQSFEDKYRYLKQYARIEYRRDGSLKYKQHAEIKECDFQYAVPKTTFTWEGIGLPAGIDIHDKRLGGITYEYAPVTSKNIEFPTNLNHIETGNVNPTELAVPYDQQMYEKTHFLLKQIKNQKRTRDLWRRRYALLNKKAPELEVDNWIQSKPLRLSDLHGKVVLLEFWGFDCGPCIGDIPDLNKVFESASNAPVTVIAVQYPVPSEHTDKVQAAISKRNIKYPVCIDRKGGKAEYFHGRTFEAYGGISGIPATFLIDYEGKIRSVGNPFNPNILKKLVDEVASGTTGNSPISSVYDKVHFAPAQINFGNVTIGEVAQKSVFIYKPDDPSFNVEIGSWPLSPARAGLFRYSDGNTAVFELRIILDSADSTGSCDTEITLRTNDQETPKVVIPVKASIGG